MTHCDAESVTLNPAFEFSLLTQTPAHTVRLRRRRAVNAATANNYAHIPRRLAVCVFVCSRPVIDRVLGQLVS